MKKKFSIILCIALISGLSITVNAAGKGLVNEKTYYVVTDMNELMWLGAEQLVSRSSIYGTENENKKSMTVIQTVKERSYQNGTVETEVMMHEIAYKDKNGKLLTAYEIAREIGYISGSKPTTPITEYGVTLVNTIYATLRLDPTSALIPAYRCDRVTTTIIVPPSGVLPTTGSIYYKHYHANEEKEQYFTANLSPGQQVFTLYPDNPQFAQSASIPLYYGLHAQSKVSLANGHTMIVQNGISQEEPW